MESSVQEGRGPVTHDQRKATKMIQLIENISYEDRQRELGLISLEKGRFWGDLTAAYLYLKDCCKKE